MKNEEQVDESKYVDCEDFTRKLIEDSKKPFEWFHPSNRFWLILVVVCFPITLPYFLGKLFVK